MFGFNKNFFEPMLEAGGGAGGGGSRQGVLRNQPRGTEGVPRNNAARGSGVLGNQPRGRTGGGTRSRMKQNAQKIMGNRTV